MGREAIVIINGDDVFEDLFQGGRTFQQLAMDSGFLTRIWYGFHRLETDEAATRAALYLIYTGRGTFTPQQQRLLADLVAAGRGLIVIHSANVLGSTPDGEVSPDYRTAFELIGSRYASHGPEPRWSDVTVRFTHAHPVSDGIPEFTTFLEHYRVELADPGIEVLATRDAPYGLEPLVTVRAHGSGRVVYVQLGHDMRTFGEPSFQQLIAQAMTWSAAAA